MKKWLSSMHFLPKGSAANSARAFQLSELQSTGYSSETNHGALDSQHTIAESSDNGMRRQLVQVLLRDVSRRHGLPKQCIECQMLVVASRSRGPGMVVRLVLRQWDERILRYSFAIQNALQTEIVRFDPKAGDWLHGVSWQLEYTDCPYTRMPEKSFWNAVRMPTAERFSDSVGAVGDESADASDADADTAAAVAARLAFPARVQPAMTHKAPPIQAGLQHVGPLAEPSALGELPQPGNRVVAASESESEAALKDLEQLFFIRDQELTRSSEATARHYGVTEASPLQRQ